MSHLQRLSPATLLTVQKMAFESYNPDRDQRGCISARLVPLDMITNVDVTGIMVGVAGEL